MGGGKRKRQEEGGNQEKKFKKQASVNPYHDNDSSSATAKFSRYKNTSMGSTRRDQSETSRSGGNNSRDSRDFSSQSRRSDEFDLCMPYNKKNNNRYSDDYNKTSNCDSQRFSSRKVWGTDSGTSSSYGRNHGSSSTSDSRLSYSPSRGNENWWGRNIKQQDSKSNYKDNTERKSDGSPNKIGHRQSNETDRSSKRNKSRDRKSNNWHIRPYSNKNYTRITGDKELDEFWKFWKTCTEDSFVKVEEIQEDLFKMPDEYALAHCVAEDMIMGRGIAVQFSQQFKRHDELYQQRQKQGGLAVLQVDNERYIYYLVTKKYSYGKPTIYTMWSSLNKLQQHIEEHQVKKLAIPKIGCGLDRLEWSEVKPMIEYIFRNTDIKITVCYFQQNYGRTKKHKQKADPPKNPKQTRMDQYVTKEKVKAELFF